MKDKHRIKWAENLHQMDIQEYGKKVFPNTKYFKKQMQNLETLDQERLSSKKEHGDKEGFYRTQFISSVPIYAQYRGRGELVTSMGFAESEDHAGAFRKMYYGLNNCKVFSPSDDLFHMLMLTDLNKGMESQPPYPTTFISKVWHEPEINITYWGVMMMKVEKEEIYDHEKWEGKTVRPIMMEKTEESYEEMPDEFYNILIMGYDHDVEQYFIRDGYMPLKDSDNPIDDIELLYEKTLKTDKLEGEKTVQKHKEIALTVKKLFHYMNTPNVQYVKQKDRHIMDKGNRRRMRKGKPPSPSHSVITIDGQTKRYLDKIKKENQEENSIQKLHWVRGHFRVFRDEEYWGDKAGDKTWIRPHLRGDGKLMDQEYQMTQ